MLKKNITYTNYENEEYTETFYFNLNKAELMDLELGYKGGVSKALQHMVDKGDSKGILDVIVDLIKRSYGERSADGKRFLKSPELVANFVGSEAYSNLLIELMSDVDALNSFMLGIMPQDIRPEAEKALAKKMAEDMAALEAADGEVK